MTFKTMSVTSDLVSLYFLLISWDIMYFTHEDPVLMRKHEQSVVLFGFKTGRIDNIYFSPRGETRV